MELRYADLTVDIDENPLVAIIPELNNVSKPTATRDLQKLVSLEVIEMTGTSGENIKYILVGS